MNRKIMRSCRWHTAQDPEQCREILNSLIERFTELGLLDDESYARGMVTSLRHRGLAARAIEMRLQAKGLPRDLVRRMLSVIDDDTNGNSELTAALRLAQRKKIGPWRRTGRATDEEEKERRRELATLARAGFGYDIAQTIIEMTQEDAANLPC